MNNRCLDIGFHSLNKFGEQLCGDHVEVVEQNGGDGNEDVVVVLADGLGSGVKANILSTLTSKIISTMMANGMPIEECVSTIAATLPVCSVRKVAYSTFTIIVVRNGEEAEIIQYDNPNVILLRDGKNVELPVTSVTVEGKNILRSKIKIRENDVFVAMSDGAVYAGVGKTLNYGWQRENIVSFMEMMYDADFTAKTLSAILLEQCAKLYGYEPGDDTTVCTVRVRTREPMNILIGPPSNPDDAQRMMKLFFSRPGRHIVCGGTTSTIAADFLQSEITSDMDYFDPEIPPTAKIKGVDLVTEGIITINKTLSYAKNYLDDNRSYKEWSFQKDGASLIARMLFENATDISFFVGKAVNPAHQNPALPIHFNIKMHLVEELAEALRKMRKNVVISYF
ncbi:MAG: SpoIIE family protein phosphatase [Oscillospiraceae bacterium]